MRPRELAQVPEDHAKTGPLAAGAAEPDRRAQILAAAEEIFFEKGYERACIDDLIARVGGSKRTIYNTFESKEGLFTAVVREILTEHGRQIHAIADSDAAGGTDLKQIVREYARAMQHIVFAPRLLALYRLVVGESARFPHLAKAWYDEGPRKVAVELTNILERHKAKGEISVSDCSMAAEQFLGLVRDNNYMAVMLGLCSPPDARQAEARIDALVDLFLHGISA
jgi:AcrR family transcriptional regulator